MPAPRTVRAAAAQLSPDFESVDGTLNKVLDTLDQAAAKAVQLIVFPETFVPYYPYFSFVKPPVQMGADHMRLYERAVVVVGVNERDHGSLYNAQLIFNADGSLLLKRRKITPTFHERMLWGQGDGAGLKVVATAVGRVGALACWEHYNPLARYALMAQHEEIHCAQFPGSLVGPIFGDQIEVTIRHHALEAGCFVINATGWLTDAQITAITPDAGLQKALRGGCNTAIVSPEGVHLAAPLREGEGLVIADLDMSLITKRKRMMDSVGHYARPELLSLLVNDRPATTTTTMAAMPATAPMPSPAAAPMNPVPARSTHDEPDHAAVSRESTADDRAAILRVAAA